MNRSFIPVLIVLLITIGVGGYVYAKKLNKTNHQLSSLDFIPTDYSSLIIEINNPSQQLGELFNTNLIWKELNQSNRLRAIETFWNQSDSSFGQLKNNCVSLTLFNTKSSSDDFCFLLKMEENITDSVQFSDWKTQIVEEFILFTKQEDLSKFPINNESVTPLTSNEDFILLNDSKGKGKDKVCLYLKEENKWGIYDVTFSPDQLFANGYTVNNGNASRVNSSLDLSMFSILPAEFKSINFYHFDTLTELKIDSNYLEKKEKECNCEAGYYAYNWIESPIALYESMYDNATYLILKVASVNSYKESINDLVADSLKMEEDDNLVVRPFNHSFNYNSLFNSTHTYNYLVRINDFVVFSHSKTELERLVFQVYSKLTIENKEELYSFLSTNINQKSNQIHISGGMKLSEFELKEGISIAQVNHQRPGLSYNSFLYSKEIKLDGSRTNPKWKIEFDTLLYPKIYVVNNHRTQDKDYLVQDQLNTLYFITPNGEIKWKKKIGNPVLGEIKNIDVLGNNKYQMIFTTKDNLFMIDILGRDVTSFPVKILDSVTANVSVMDYDNNLNFRFLIPTTTGIKSVDKNGNLVKGWAKPKQNKPVTSDINHLLINNKDYILVQDQANSLYFYNRKGEQRHTVSHTFGYPMNILYGSSIETTRAIFLDSSTNTVKRQFFSDKKASVLLSANKKIKEFFLVDYDGDKNKDFVLVFEDEIVVYSEDLIISKKISLPSMASNIQIFEGGFGFINQFGDLSIRRGEEVKIIDGVRNYRIDFYKNKMRVLINGDKEMKLLHL